MKVKNVSKSRVEEMVRGARVKPGRYRIVVKGGGHEQTFWFEVIQ